MSDLDQYLEDTTCGPRDVVTVKMPDSPLPIMLPVIHFEYSDRHFLVLPLSFRDELSLEIMGFDRDGRRVLKRTVSLDDE